MELRADFDRREVVRPGDEAWRPSSIGGAERYMLDLGCISPNPVAGVNRG